MSINTFLLLFQLLYYLFSLSIMSLIIFCTHFESDNGSGVNSNLLGSEVKSEGRKVTNHTSVGCSGSWGAEAVQICTGRELRLNICSIQHFPSRKVLIR